jgi:hypothetical protein
VPGTCPAGCAMAGAVDAQGLHRHRQLPPAAPSQLVGWQAGGRLMMPQEGFLLHRHIRAAWWLGPSAAAAATQSRPPLCCCPCQPYQSRPDLPSCPAATLPPPTPACCAAAAAARWGRQHPSPPSSSSLSSSVSSPTVAAPATISADPPLAPAAAGWLPAA